MTSRTAHFPVLFFGSASLTPVILIALGATYGGLWVIIAFLYMTVMSASLDETVQRITPAMENDDNQTANALSVLLAFAHFLLLALAVVAMTGDWLSWAEKSALFISAGLFFGQVSNSNAHELIHRGARPLHRLGMWVYISLLFGHHTSAHVLVHHRHVATRNDPNTARLGESYYRFARRAWNGSFHTGLMAETARLAKAGKPKWHNPYLTYCGGALLMVILAMVIGGATGTLAYVALATFAQFQLLMSDYVQHYGLTRATTNGQPEPVGDRHSWNSPHWFTSALMLNAPRHSDHHAHPSRPYLALRLPDDSPMLPRSLPIMAFIALYPPLWRRVMDPRVAKWTTK